MTPEELTKARFNASTARNLLTLMVNKMAERRRLDPEFSSVLGSYSARITEARECLAELCRLLNGQTAGDTGLRGKDPVPYRTAP